MPDSPFYGFKTFFEDIDLYFTADPVAKAEKQLAIAETRLAEAVIVAEQGKGEYVPQLVVEYNDNLASAGATIDSIPVDSIYKAELMSHAAELVSDDSAVFESIKADVPTTYHYVLNQEKSEAIEFKDSVTASEPASGGDSIYVPPNNGGYYGGGGGGSGGGSSGGGGSGGGYVEPVPDPNDLTKPLISIAQPVNGSIFLTDSLAVQGASSDNIKVTEVVASLNGAPFIKVAGTDSWSHVLSSLPNGAYTLYIWANDAAANTAKSAVSFVIAKPDVEPGDTTAPTVSITFPLNDGIVTGTVKAIASASDDVKVSNVIAYIDGVAVAVAAQNEESYDLTIDSTNYADGQHALKAVASDTTGNTAEAMIAITINNNIIIIDPDDPKLDPFGITMIYPTKTSAD